MPRLVISPNTVYKKRKHKDKTMNKNTKIIAFAAIAMLSTIANSAEAFKLKCNDIAILDANDKVIADKVDGFGYFVSNGVNGELIDYKNIKYKLQFTEKGRLSNFIVNAYSDSKDYGNAKNVVSVMTNENGKIIIMHTAKNGGNVITKTHYFKCI